MKNAVKIFSTLVLSVLMFSCATNPDLYKDVDANVDKADYAAAVGVIEKAQEIPEGKKKPKAPIYKEDNAVMLQLDKGILEHYAGEYEKSAADFEQGEELIIAAVPSVTEEAGTYLLNDNVRTYAGEDYEDAYVSVFNALNYAHQGKLEGALAESKKANEKLQALADKYEQGGSRIKEFVKKQSEKIVIPNYETPSYFKNSALADYIGALVFRATADSGLDINAIDSARINLVQLQQAFKDAPDVYKNSIPKTVALSGTQGNETAEEIAVPKGKARLNVIGFTGRAPLKQQAVVVGYEGGIRVRDFEGNPVKQKLEAVAPFPWNTYLKTGSLLIPVLRGRQSAVDAIKVSVEGAGDFDLELLEDMSEVIAQTYLSKISMLFLKTYIRLAIKYTLADAVAVQAGQKAAAAGVLSAAAAAKGIDASEVPDTRMARYFPGQAYVGGITLDPGTYNITVTFSNGETQKFDGVKVDAGKLNLVEAVCLK